MRTYNSLATISTTMKGKIAEDWIASLVTLYGEQALSCYRPLSDDEGIDLIVKHKGSLLEKTLYIQIKSRYNLTVKGKSFVSTIKESTVVDSYRMSIIFCYFDFEAGDFQEKLWFIPAPDFLVKANKLKEDRLGFVASPKSGEGKKWDKFLIEKKNLANAILAQMKRL